MILMEEYNRIIKSNWKVELVLIRIIVILGILCYDEPEIIILVDCSSLLFDVGEGKQYGLIVIHLPAIYRTIVPSINV